MFNFFTSFSIHFSKKIICPFLRFYVFTWSNRGLKYQLQLCYVLCFCCCSSCNWNVCVIKTFSPDLPSVTPWLFFSSWFLVMSSNAVFFFVACLLSLSTYPPPPLCPANIYETDCKGFGYPGSKEHTDKSLSSS